jgi:glycosyltransferase involved in cell wall biosynthesis
MYLSIIVTTKNRCRSVLQCFDSAVLAIQRANVESEIIIVDNGSSDQTVQALNQRRLGVNLPISILVQPRPGKALALNHALQHAKGDLLAFTDDDCLLHDDFINDAIRHDRVEPRPALRGGRIELWDPTDLPITINTTDQPSERSLSAQSMRHGTLAGFINGCNLVMRRSIFDQLGPFDENFGPGSPLFSAEDLDYTVRAYNAGLPLQYVNDMIVYHHHGRKTQQQAFNLFKRYMYGYGAIVAKHAWRQPDIARPVYWDLKTSIKELLSGTNTLFPSYGFSHRHKLMFEAMGFINYYYTLSVTPFRRSFKLTYDNPKI